jgi:acetate kinase
MHILVINSGSSSIKFSVFELRDRVSFGDPRSLFEGEVSGVGGPGAKLRFQDSMGNDLAGGKPELKAGTASEAIHAVIDVVFGGRVPSMDAVGYRVVHPGSRLKGHWRITDEVLRELEGAGEFAPLHDPAVVSVIQTVMERMPAVAHFACFDTVFHESMGEAATTYALPEAVRARGVRRYGFHGLSCESIVRQILDAVECGAMKFPRRMVIAHLGSGCSVTAVERGRSVDTTMGLTPTGGVVMGTRPGDLDPGLMLYLLRQQEGDKAAAIDAMEGMVNRAAGMVALSGMKNDMKTMRDAAAKGDEKALLAAEVFARSIRKVIGGFAWLMGGLDLIVFSGGIGEHDPASRAEILEDLTGMGVSLDDALNTAKGDGVRRVSSADSQVAVYVVPSQEDRMIALHVMEMMPE